MKQQLPRWETEIQIVQSLIKGGNSGTVTTVWHTGLAEEPLWSVGRVTQCEKAEECATKKAWHKWRARRSVSME
ncbi:hypothetical protein RIEGSTA812A_PEG_1085 [invertebrate metagenome]|uniref:Uncharacterized protein n=1 Tax=invertebrate metagenome TaxID=1711999 RepID=A0A484HCS1_9ZZZZ